MSVTPTRDLWSGKPLWLDSAYSRPSVNVKSLDEDITTDVLVIGSGICGAVTAEALSRKGLDVVIIDKRKPLFGATAASTALLQYDLDTPYSKLVEDKGEKTAKRIWLCCQSALQSLDRKIDKLGIDCNKEKCGSVYLPGNILDVKGLQKESDARNSIGLNNSFLNKDELKTRFGIERGGAIFLDDNITLNPIALMAGFLEAAIKNKSRYFAPLEVKNIIRRDNGYEAQCGAAVIHAKHIVFATGYEVPKNYKVNDYKITSSWAFATAPQPDNLWPEEANVWEAGSPYLYIRTTPEGRVICGGEDEEFSDEDKRDALIVDKTKTLQKKLKELFPYLNVEAEYSWAANFGETPKGLPMVGAVPDMPDCYAVMAYGGNGIIFSQIGAEIICALICKEGNPDTTLFPII